MQRNGFKLCMPRGGGLKRCEAEERRLASCVGGGGGKVKRGDNSDKTLDSRIEATSIGFNYTGAPNNILLLPPVAVSPPRPPYGTYLQAAWCEAAPLRLPPRSVPPLPPLPMGPTSRLPGAWLLLSLFRCCR